MTSYIRHVTLHTAHVRDVPLDELDAGAVAICRDIVGALAESDTVTHWRLPNMPGLSIAGRSGGRCISLGVFAERHGKPVNVMMIGIAAHQRCGAATWRALHAASSDANTDPDQQPATPWVATLIGPGWRTIIEPDPVLRAMMSALGSCLAAAWLDYLAERQS